MGGSFEENSGNPGEVFPARTRRGHCYKNGGSCEGKEYRHGQYGNEVGTWEIFYRTKGEERRTTIEIHGAGQRKFSLFKLFGQRVVEDEVCPVVESFPTNESSTSEWSKTGQTKSLGFADLSRNIECGEASKE